MTPPSPSTYATPPSLDYATPSTGLDCGKHRRIDFRELVRDLFSLYKTRIWMQQLEPETTPTGGPVQTPYSPQEMHGMPDGSIDMGGGMNMGGPML